MEPWLFERVELADNLYRVSRPGRSLGSKALVPDEVVRRWVNGVADQLENNVPLAKGRNVHYVCLLGWKADGKREIADFYNARGPQDGDDPETLRKPLWQAFLNAVAQGRLVFEVYDQGEGLLADEAEKVFDPFFHADRVGEERAPGAGLGLPVAKQIVEAHGGKIWAESPPKNQPDSKHHFSGAKVAFWIPSRAHAPAEPQPTPFPVLAPEGGTS